MSMATVSQAIGGATIAFTSANSTTSFESKTSPLFPTKISIPFSESSKKGKMVACTSNGNNSSLASNPTLSSVVVADKAATTMETKSRGGQGCKLIGCGSAVPNLKISNDDLAQIVDTDDDWIHKRTGIRNRRVLSGNDSLTSLAVDAAKNALQMAEVEPDGVDLILMCTSTPEDLFGSAPQIQKALGCKNNPLAYDITAACSGFVLGLVSAACHIRGGGFQNVLVIGADSLSRYVDWTDRGTCILFGDAAGAVLVQACDGNEDGLFAFDVHSDGEGQRHLNASMREETSDERKGMFGSNGSAVEFPPRPYSYSCIQMNGKEVFRFANKVVPESIELSLEKAGLSSSDIDWLLLHQANQRIIDGVANRLDIPDERIISNLANYGNTSAASIPLALDEAVRSGKVKPGNIIAAAGFGAGLTWASAILRWG